MKIAFRNENVPRIDADNHSCVAINGVKEAMIDTNSIPGSDSELNSILYCIW